MTENLYDKENPKSRLRVKPQGWESFYRGMPNNYERTEMITRRLLKDYDGDLAKISINTRKPYDKAQRWRGLKNHVNVLKNPLGFYTWRRLYAENQNRGPKVWYSFVYVCLAGIVWNMARKSQLQHDRTENYKYMIGARTFHPVNSEGDDRLITEDDTMAMKKKMSNLNLQFKNPSKWCMTTAYWARDQNFRKYFEMRKKNGIEPSTNYSKFYNKDKAKSYYDGLTEADFMYQRAARS